MSHSIDPALVDRALKLRRSGPISNKAGDLRLIRNEDDPDVTIMYLYDEIGASFWGGGVSAEQFVKELQGVDTPKIELHINSPGGDVFDGVAMYNALLAHAAEVHVIVDGLAASAASFIATAGDQVSMGLATELMIHDAWTFTFGNEEDHREVADVLGQISGSIAGLYADRAGGEVEEWRDRMRAETWYTADEAVVAGLADDTVSRTKESVDDAWLGEFRFAGRAQAPAPNEPPAAATASAAAEKPDGDVTDDQATRDAKLARADALIEGRDPDAMADPFVAARIAGRLEAERELAEINAQ